MGFSQALSGLNASSGNLNVISNNIANSQTVGFKSSTTRFADIYAAGSRVGMGVKTAGVVQNFTNGTPETTNRALDLAISGTGFFTFQQNGQTVYSRNGQLTLTPDGYLENSQGAQLVGVSGAPVQVPSAGLAATATTKVGATLNLDANATKTYTDSATGITYSYANTATVYDSLGNSHTLTMFFSKDAAPATNQWTVRTSLDGTASATTQTVKFDYSGVLTSGATSPYSYTMSNGAAPLSFNLDLTGTTQFGNDFEMTTLTQNGYTAGSLVGFTIDENGNIIGNYSNDQSNPLGQIQLASFRSPEGLQPIGDNAWTATTASGQAILGTAGIGQFGSIQTGMTESSNVDLTKELVNLIVAQRTFQANSQSVKAQSEVLQQAVNLGN